MAGITLHNAVIKDDIQTTLQLLAGDQDPNQKRLYENVECAPIHVCAKLGRMLCLKALIILDADIDLEDGNKNSARHILCTTGWVFDDTRAGMLDVLETAGAVRCKKGKGKGCQPGCMFDGRDNGKYFCRGNEEDEHMKKILKKKIKFGRILGRNETDFYQPQLKGPRVLCLDGGGIRGLVPLVMLKVLEGHFNKQDASQGVTYYINNFFDLFAGTSTGGIISLLLAKGMPVTEILKKYILLKDRVFDFKPYNPDNLEDFLKENFGAATKIRDLKKRVMIMTTNANVKPFRLKIYENIRPEARNPELGELLRTVGRKTGSAPGLFRLTDLECIDGGIKANNPTFQVLVELVKISSENKGLEMAQGSGSAGGPGQSGTRPVQKTSGKKGDKKFDPCEDWNKEIKADAIVSMGTSMGPVRAANPEDIATCWPSTRGRAALAVVGGLFTGHQLIEFLVEEVTRSEGREVEKSGEFCDAQNIPFMRLNPNTHQAVATDATDSSTLTHLMYDAFRYMCDNRSDMNLLYNLLRRN